MAKKSFTEDLNNPALAFLSGEEAKKAVKSSKFKTDETEDRLKKYMEELRKAGYTLKQEGKSRRVQLVMTESLYNAAREKIAGVVDPVTKRQLSFNQYINNLIQNDIDTTQE